MLCPMDVLCLAHKPRYPLATRLRITPAAIQRTGVRRARPGGWPSHLRERRGTRQVEMIMG
jgi:hypothetical protein